MKNVNLKRRSAIILSSCLLVCGAAIAKGIQMASAASGKAHINVLKCSGCMRCARSCPNKAISKFAGVVTVDAKKCTGCGVCVYDCGKGAITVG